MFFVWFYTVFHIILYSFYMILYCFYMILYCFHMVLYGFYYFHIFVFPIIRLHSYVAARPERLPRILKCGCVPWNVATRPEMLSRPRVLTCGPISARIGKYTIFSFARFLQTKIQFPLILIFLNVVRIQSVTKPPSTYGWSGDQTRIWAEALDLDLHPETTGRTKK